MLLAIPFLSSTPGDADCLWFHIGQLFNYPIPFLRPLPPPWNPFKRLQLDNFRPQTCPRSRKISHLRPEISPVMPQICLRKWQISSLRPRSNHCSMVTPWWSKVAIKLTLLNSSSFEQLQLASERLNPYSIVYTDQHNQFGESLDLIPTFLSGTKTRIK